MLLGSDFELLLVAVSLANDLELTADVVGVLAQLERVARLAVVVSDYYLAGSCQQAELERFTGLLEIFGHNPLVFAVKLVAHADRVIGWHVRQELVAVASAEYGDDLVVDELHLQVKVHLQRGDTMEQFVISRLVANFARILNLFKMLGRASFKNELQARIF